MTLEMKTIDERQRVGIFAVVLGPDGSGKSTVVDRIIGESASYYSDLWQFHWRPGLLPQPGRREKKNSSRLNPPLPPTGYAYGRVVSFLRYSYFLADFILGYWFRIYPRRRRGQLIIGERWYFDVVVNPQRYGFKLPGWMLRIGGYLIPKPDLTVLLTADPGAIFKRKPELTVEQITQQIKAMRGILPQYPNGVEIATDIPLDESVVKLSQELEETTARLSHIDYGWRAFPRYGDAKLLVANAASVRLALQLYHPYSLVGKIVKTIAEILPRVFTTKRLCSSLWCKDIAVVSRLIHRVLRRKNLAINYSTGTPGPHRKMTAQVSDKKGVITYVKVAQSEAARALLNCEVDCLRDLNYFSDTEISIPAVIDDVNDNGFHLLFLTAPVVMSSVRPVELDRLDILFIESMLSCGTETLTLRNVWDASFPPQFSENVLIQNSRCVLEYLVGSSGIRVGPAHGDFAPWNTLKLENGGLFVFDWEYFRLDAPVLSDLFQRVFMPDWLVLNLKPDAAVSHLIELRLEEKIESLVDKLDMTENEYIAYLLLFLLRQGCRNRDEQALAPEFIQACLRDVVSRVDTSVESVA